jgi:hypothetical protein
MDGRSGAACLDRADKPLASWRFTIVAISGPRSPQIPNAMALNPAERAAAGVRRSEWPQRVKAV